MRASSRFAARSRAARAGLRRALAAAFGVCVAAPAAFAQTAPPPVAPEPLPPAPAPAAPAEPDAAAPGALEPSAPPPAPTPAPAPLADEPAGVPPVAAPSTVPAAATPELEEDEPKKKKKKKKQNPRIPGEFSIRGRVYVLGEYSRQERTVIDLGSLEPRTEYPHALDLTIPSARVSLRYQAPQEWLTAEIELEAADGPDMKDAYIQARDRHFTAKVGQFKMPVSAYAMESLWDLPVVRRGLLHELLTDWLDVGGRHPGILLGVRGRGGIKPSFNVGAFQGRVLEEDIVPNDRNLEPVSLEFVGWDSYTDAQSYVARAAIELFDALDLGAYYLHRVGSPDVGEIEHYPTGGLDARLDTTFGRIGLRVWADAMLGKSWYVHADKAARDEDVTFLVGRTSVGLRFGGMQPDEFYVEPYGLLAALEPDTDVVSDFMLEAALGVNVGLWDRARIGLQGELISAQRNFPTSNTGYFGAVADRTSLLLLGAVTF